MLYVLSMMHLVEEMCSTSNISKDIASDLTNLKKKSRFNIPYTFEILTCIWSAMQNWYGKNELFQKTVSDVQIAVIHTMD